MGMIDLRKALVAVARISLIALVDLCAAGLMTARAASPSGYQCRAIIAAPQSATAGSMIRITDDSIAPKGATLTSRAWFFGDGVSLSGQNAIAKVAHAYAFPGQRMQKRYEIRLLLSFSNGAQCSTSTPILIVSGARQKGFTRLGLRGSTVTTAVVAAVPGCGVLDATMNWVPRFGIERSDYPYPVLQLFGTAVITSNGITHHEPDNILVVVRYLQVVASDPRYTRIAELNRIWRARSCTVKSRRLAAEMASGFSFAPADIRSGTAKRKCNAGNSSRVSSCKIDPSKTLHVRGTWGSQHLSGKVDLHIHFAKKTCRYLGPANPSPLTAPHASWYKCPKG